MEPRDLRLVGPFRLVDRAVTLVRSDPRRLLWPVLAGSAPLVVALLALFVAERVEGVTGLRWVFAIAIAALVGPRTVGWAIAGRTIVLSAEGQDPTLDETASVASRRRLALWKAGLASALAAMPWIFAIALLSLVTPILVILVLPFVSLRWVGAAPTLPTRVVLEEGSVFRSYLHAWDDLRGNRAAGFLSDVLLWLATGFVAGNGWVALLLLSELAQSVLGMDLAFAQAFLDPRNGFFVVLLVGGAWLVVEPVRAAIGALLAVDGRVRNQALDLDRMVSSLEASSPARSRAPTGASVAAAIGVALLGASSVAQAQQDPPHETSPAWAQGPFATPIPTVSIEIPIPIDPLPEARSASPSDDDARRAVRGILARREYRELAAARELGFFEWIRQLFDGFWGDDEEPWDPDLDLDLPALPLPSAWFFVGLAAIGVISVVAVLWPRRRAARVAVSTAPHAQSVDPRERAPEEIVDEAEALFRQGDLAAALRRLYLATLVALDRRRLIVFDPALTNWQYLRQLPPGGGPGEPRALFARLCRLFDHKWYGREPATEADYREAREITRALLPPSGEETRAAA